MVVVWLDLCLMLNHNLIIFSSYFPSSYYSYISIYNYHPISLYRCHYYYHYYRISFPSHVHHSCPIICALVHQSDVKKQADAVEVRSLNIQHNVSQVRTILMISIGLFCTVVLYIFFNRFVTNAIIIISLGSSSSACCQEDSPLPGNLI
jgi:hypothetical protein